MLGKLKVLAEDREEPGGVLKMDCNMSAVVNFVSFLVKIFPGFLLNASAREVGFGSQIPQYVLSF